MFTIRQSPIRRVRQITFTFYDILSDLNDNGSSVRRTLNPEPEIFEMEIVLETYPKPILVYTLENQLRVDDLMTLGERLEDSH